MPISDDCFKEFEFDLPRSLLRDLVELLESMGRAPLDLDTVNRLIPEEQGVYQLYLNDILVYIGKTDAEAGLCKRLARHAKKIHQRQNLTPSQISFKAVRVFVFTAVDLESQLINHYNSLGAFPLWNNSGFGANDPGRERDTTTLKQSHFDKRYPIDIDVPLQPVSLDTTLSVADALSQLKNEVPYVIRFGGGVRRPHTDLVSTTITISSGPRTARSILTLIRAALAGNWQVTVLPGYVIMYPEQRQYPEARPL
jgi:hypothetical protein